MSRTPYDDVRVLPRRTTAAEKAIIIAAVTCAAAIRAALAELRKVPPLDDAHPAQESIDGALTDGAWVCAAYLDPVAWKVLDEIKYELEVVNDGE